MYGWMEGLMYGWRDRCMDRCMDGWIDGGIDVWIFSMHPPNPVVVGYMQLFFLTSGQLKM